jgi:hypothetical protein
VLRAAAVRKRASNQITIDVIVLPRPLQPSRPSHDGPSRCDVGSMKPAVSCSDGLFLCLQRKIIWMVPQFNYYHLFFFEEKVREYYASFFNSKKHLPPSFISV